MVIDFKGRGPKKHLKRLYAPNSWMLQKLQGKWCYRPSCGPHKLRECIPLGIILRHKLKYALNGREVTTIVNDKEGVIKVDQKIRRDERFPLGLNDILSIQKTGENYRIMYDVKGRFILKQVKEDESKFKLCKVKRKEVGPNKIPYIVTHDARTIRYPHPDIDINDTVKIDLFKGEIADFVKFEHGNLAYCVAGNNIGRVGTIMHTELHPGSFNIVHIKDANQKTFATRMGNIMVIGKGKKSWMSLPKEQGLYLSALEKKLDTEKNKKK